MDSRYTLLMLSARTQTLQERRGPGRGLTWEDVCLAAGGLPRHQWLYLRYVIQREDRVLPELRRRALLEATKVRAIRDAHRGVPERKGAIGMMIEASLAELRDSSLCKTCNGRGEVVVPPTIICESCDGKGTVRLSERRRASLVGKDHRAYARHWRELHDLVYMMMCGWESSAAQHLARFFEKGG